ncbi:endogenous retrovirus group K member 18 Env polyprotein-like [Eumetopias jubatus]|uniref:endogenous retrovirus group K member 18 Env polyprotein-like n=1 Tax=Eumetopias jubatus TaxID=34886 RepID=UPI001015F0A0|nr:endogenous retrovirus group K member 18 Env polyprotein-like [Eumetopias jubatus]
MAWHEGGLASPRPRLVTDKDHVGPEQWDLWKLPAALASLYFYAGNFSRTSRSSSDYWFTYNSSISIQACVHLPYLIAIGEIEVNYTMRSTDCPNCRLYTCLNRTIPFNSTMDSILLLQARMGVWIPVNLTRSWEENPVEGLLSKMLSELLSRRQRFVSTLVLVILRLTGIATTAAIARVALQKSLQTQDFVKTWQEKSHNLWLTQTKLDKELQSKVSELEQAVKWIGDQLIDLQQQVFLKCDWNSSSVCVTPYPFNASKHTWEQIKYHLQDIRGNLSLDIQTLQQEMFETFKNALPKTQYGQLASDITHALDGLDPQGCIWIPGRVSPIVLVAHFSQF